MWLRAHLLHLLCMYIFCFEWTFLNLSSRVMPDIQVSKNSVHDTRSIVGNQIKARWYPKTHLVRRRLGLDLPQEHTVDVVEVDSVTSTSFPATVGGQDVEIQVVQENTNLFVSSDDGIYAHGPHRHGKHCPHHRGFKCTCAHKHRHHQYEGGDDEHSEEHPQEGDDDWQGWKIPDDEIGHDVPHQSPEGCSQSPAKNSTIPSGSSNTTETATPSPTATKEGCAPGTPAPGEPSTNPPAGQEPCPKGNSTLTPSAGAPSPDTSSSPDDRKTESPPSDPKGNSTLPHPAGPPSPGASPAHPPAQDVKTVPSPPGSEKPLPNSQGTGADGGQQIPAQVLPGSSGSSNHIAPVHAGPPPNNGQDVSGSSKPSEEPLANKSSDTTSLKDAVPTTTGAEPPPIKDSAPGSSNGGKSISSTPGSAEPGGDSTSHSDDIDM
jgi:hypothetical protein